MMQRTAFHVWYEEAFPDPPYPIPETIFWLDCLAIDGTTEFEAGKLASAPAQAPIAYTQELLRMVDQLVDLYRPLPIVIDLRESEPFVSKRLALRFDLGDEEGLKAPMLTRRHVAFNFYFALKARLWVLLNGPDDETGPAIAAAPQPPANNNGGRILSFPVHNEVDDSPLIDFPPDGYYSSDHWTRTAAETRKRWNYKCALNVLHKGPVEVHHRTYATLWHEGPFDTVPLCEECHELHHGRLADVPLQMPLYFKRAA